MIELKTETHHLQTCSLALYYRLLSQLGTSDVVAPQAVSCNGLRFLKVLRKRSVNS